MFTQTKTTSKKLFLLALKYKELDSKKYASSTVDRHSNYIDQYFKII